jgi:hypothetical protein
MNYNNEHFRKLLTMPINNLINEFIDSVLILSPIKNDLYPSGLSLTLVRAI